MNAPERLPLPDIQSVADARNIAIERVGVKSVVYPIQVAGPEGAQHTIAHVDLYVGLDAAVKGTHMSRFLEVLEAGVPELSYQSVHALMQTMVERLGARRGYMQFRFPYFVRKTAPVSKVQSLMDYHVTLTAEQIDSRFFFTQEVLVPVTSLCPCSKNISQYGAHNQRSHLTLAAEIAADMPIEVLVGIAESVASCELWGLLKRPDEKYVTERAYENPKFVEDLVRDLALALDQDARILSYSVASENFESIHNHSAYARIERDKRLAA
jgi:GTP cyclohydrolase I